MHLAAWHTPRGIARSPARDFPRYWLLLAGIPQLLLAVVYFIVHHDHEDSHLHELHHEHHLNRLSGNAARKYAANLVVRAVVSDTGAWNTIQPVLLTALEEGAQVLALLTGASARKHREGTLVVRDSRIAISYETSADKTTSRVTDFVGPQHHLTLVGASTSVDGTHGVVAAMCTSHASQLALVEDRYATALQSLQMIRDTCLDRMTKMILCAADSIAEDLIAKHTSFPGKVVVTGSPMFDHDVQDQRALPDGEVLKKRRARIRSQLGINSDQIVVLIAGQSAGLLEVVQLLVGALQAIHNRLQYRVRAVVRHHPRAKPEDTQRVMDFIHSSPVGVFDVDPLEVAMFPSSDSIVPMADIVLSGYSTTNYYAILWQVPAVVYAATPILSAKFHNDKHLDEIPEVKAGAAWSVSSIEEMQTVIMDVAAHRSGVQSTHVREMREAQAQLCRYHDGNAARRVWSEVSRPLSSA